MATLSTQQLIQKLQQVAAMVPQTTNHVSINPSNSNIAQQIRDIAEEQAKQTMIQLMKQETELKKQTFLTIENIDKIRGHKYSTA